MRSTSMTNASCAILPLATPRSRSPTCVACLPGVLAENALYIFETYGDVYQIAGAYRTLASCYRQTGDYESALNNLEQALSDTIINQAPDLVASIREQMSVAYAAIDDLSREELTGHLRERLMVEAFIIDELQ